MSNIPTNTTVGNRSRAVAYWLVTGLLAFELAYGATWDLRQIPLVRDVVTHLGYPVYLLLILGTWKLLGAIALVAPRLLLLKEWAYAGIFFLFSGALCSHLAAGDNFSKWIWPTAFLALNIASWFLRPPSRRIQPVHNAQHGG
ncbi:MAG TPA: DoxX family protein [Chitinophaga sp.]|uniref:DoxX family protein n=1 Tax=Chitinophaga sp. TaxID=1869181 RepID=UPI002DB9FBD2|nr:DoxX family protein [Chitinophaga sp.]HEU4552536.1 DoxX family protein [Chitinophaga sp.]